MIAVVGLIVIILGKMIKSIDIDFITNEITSIIEGFGFLLYLQSLKCQNLE